VQYEDSTGAWCRTPRRRVITGGGGPWPRRRPSLRMGRTTGQAQAAAPASPPDLSAASRRLRPRSRSTPLFTGAGARSCRTDDYGRAGTTIVSRCVGRDDPPISRSHIKIKEFDGHEKQNPRAIAVRATPCRRCRTPNRSDSIELLKRLIRVVRRSLGRFRAELMLSHSWSVTANRLAIVLTTPRAERWRSPHEPDGFYWLLPGKRCRIREKFRPRR